MTDVRPSVRKAKDPDQLNVLCPWCKQPLFVTIGEEENLCQAECRSESCQEYRFTVGTQGKKEWIIFIEDDQDANDGMVFHYGKWERNEPNDSMPNSQKYRMTGTKQLEEPKQQTLEGFF
jgi:hypothetical protein